MNVNVNVNVEKARRGIAAVIDNSTRTVLIVSGKLAHEVYESPVVTTAIERALERKVDFKVIVGPDLDSESKFISEKLSSIYCLKSWHAPHFVVGDSKHVRYEPAHSEQANIPAAPNTFALDVPEAGEMLVTAFNSLLESADQCRLST